MITLLTFHPKKREKKTARQEGYKKSFQFQKKESKEMKRLDDINTIEQCNLSVTQKRLNQRLHRGKLSIEKRKLRRIRKQYPHLRFELKHAIKLITRRWLLIE